MTDTVRPDLTLVASFPKCGRTWLRFMFAQYLQLELELPLEVDMRTCYFVAPNLDAGPGGLATHAAHARPGVPLLAFTHGPPEYIETIFKFAGVLAGAPAAELAGRRIVFMVRDL